MNSARFPRNADDRRLAAAVTDALADKRVDITLAAGELFEILAFMQLALRHPAVPQAHRERVMGTARRIRGTLLDAAGPEHREDVAEMIRRGFDPMYDQ